VGLDFEWKPDKRAGDDNPIALMQLACWDTVLIVRTTGCSELPPWLAGFLEDPGMAKVTASFDLSDKAKLRTSFGWTFDERAVASSFIDIAELAKNRDIPHGMYKMSKFFDLPMLKLKAVGSSNWAKLGGLTSSQKEYAADDAFFQLYLVGKLLEHRPPASGDDTAQRALDSWRATRGAMDQVMQRVDNSAYRESFMELREVVSNAVGVLSKALGSGGCATLNDILKFKPVSKALAAAHKKSLITLNAQFLRQNTDIFQVFFVEGQVKVRPREAEEEEVEESELPAGDDGDTSAFISEVLEMLVAYEPPLEKRPTVLNRHVPEPLWVPARAVLSKSQCRRVELCVGDTDSIETSFSDEDGLLLRFSRHPRGADDVEHMEQCVGRLSSDLGIEEDEAKRRLNADDKFMQFWGALRLVETGSAEEAHVERSLRARVRILADCHRIGARVSPPLAWDAVREGLEKVKWYRQVLGVWLASDGEKADAELQECIDAVVAAWPDVAKVNEARKRRAEASNGSEPANKKHRAEGHEGKGRGKGKGKGGKGKGKGRGKDKEQGDGKDTEP